MEVKFHLEQPKRERSSLSAIVHYKGKRFKKGIGISVLTNFWNKDSRRCKQVKDYPEGTHINYLLVDINKQITDFFYRCDNEKRTPTIEQYRSISSSTFTTASAKNMHELINVHIATHSYNFSTLKNYKQTQLMLSKYSKNLMIEDLDLDFYNKYKKWFTKQTYTTSKKAEPKHYSLNTFGTHIKCIKTVLNNISKDLRPLVDSDIKDKKFKTDNETADTIYLTEEELIQIHQFTPTLEQIKTVIGKTYLNNELKSLEAHINCKNWFLIGAFTALRVSDYRRIDDFNVINDNLLKIKPKKGTKKNEDLFIPIHWVVKEILQSPNFDIKTPPHEQKINDKIKNVCQMMGFDEPISITRTEGGKQIERITPKYSLVTNHTGRRSAATNMYKAKIPTLAIMKITGHKTQSSFMKYIKISAEENAEILLDNDFWAKK